MAATHLTNIFFTREYENSARSLQGERAPICCHEDGDMMAHPEVPTLGELIQRKNNYMREKRKRTAKAGGSPNDVMLFAAWQLGVDEVSWIDLQSICNVIEDL